MQARRRALACAMVAQRRRGGASSGGAPGACPRTSSGGPQKKNYFFVQGLNMQRIRGRKADILAWTNPDEIEGVALEQLKNISALPWVFHHVAAMPDVHFGKGATVGSVIAMKGAVSPAAVS